MKKTVLTLFLLVFSIAISSFMLSGCTNGIGGINGTYYSTLSKKSYVELFKKRRCYIHTNYVDSMGKWYIHKNRITMQADSAVLHFKYLNGALYLKVKGKINHFEVIDKIPFKVDLIFVKKFQLKSLANQNHGLVQGKFKGIMSIYQKKMEQGMFGGSYLQWVSSNKPVILTISGKNKILLSSKNKHLFRPEKYRFKIYGDIMTISRSRTIFNYSGNTIDGQYFILKHKNDVALVNLANKAAYFIKK